MNQPLTGKSYCIRCLQETPLDRFLANDHYCDACVALRVEELFKYRTRTDEQEAAIARLSEVA